jgi:uncharacterized protein (TIGR01440 family)
MEWTNATEKAKWLEGISHAVETIAGELSVRAQLNAKRIVVIGTSTSEVAGQQIGSSGSEEVAAAIFEGLLDAQHTFGFQLAFQCCEHLNRALVVKRETAERFNLQEVTAIPVRKAGGAMASYAFRTWPDAVLVEAIQAHAGIDIGDTLIGMHLKSVVVPYRPSVRKIGSAHVNAAFTRPKLIGGQRAVYTWDAANGQTDRTLHDFSLQAQQQQQ